MPRLESSESFKTLVAPWYNTPKDLTSATAVVGAQREGKKESTDVTGIAMYYIFFFV